LSLLSRVFILDETNAAALNLQKVIQAETAPAAGADGGDFDLDLDEGEAGNATASAAASSTPLPSDVLDSDEPDPTDIPMEGLDDAEMAALDRGIPSGIRDAQKKAAQADPGEPRGAGLSRKFLALYAVGLLVVLAAGWGALKYIGRSRDPALDEAVKQMQAVGDGKAPGEAASKDAKAKDGENDTGSPGEATAAAPALGPDDLPALLARAKTLAEAGEFSQAIIAFNQALEIDPQHPVATAGLAWLASAAQLYREQRDHEDKLAGATAAWERGDYTSALRTFYRLPATATEPRFMRYKRNGWHNLGVLALQGGECLDARAHFEEMRGEDPADPQLPELTELAKVCDYSRQDPAYLQRLRELSLRGMDD
jgi:tetratricopeptide (TPR) repeat protein